MVTSKKHMGAAILTAEDRAQLRRYFEDNIDGIEEVAKVISQVLGKGDELPIEITFRLSSQETGTSEGQVSGAATTYHFARGCFDDGTCGCVEDPPGISYSC